MATRLDSALLTRYVAPAHPAASEMVAARARVRHLTERWIEALNRRTDRTQLSLDLEAAERRYVALLGGTFDPRQPWRAPDEER